MNAGWMNNVVGDHLLIAHYVKYDRLTWLINNEFKDSNYNEINLYIDAYSMIKSVYGLDPSQFIDRYSIASCIINACAHYRRFFWTRYKVTCKIWIVFSRMEESINEARAFCRDYSNIFMDKPNPAMDKMIEDNMEILRLLCPYIPDVMFIYSQYEPGLVFGRICDTAYSYSKNGRIPNIIVSKDNWNLQVVSEIPLTYMLRPKKRNNEDLSVLISRNIVLDYYIRNTKNCDIFNCPEYMSFIMCSTKFPERGLKAIHNLSTIVNMINAALLKNDISIGKKIYDFEGLCKDLAYSTKKNIKTFEISLRMNAMGFNACMFRYLMSPKIDNIEIINLYDPDSVKQINETYFRKVPLDLMSL